MKISLILLTTLSMLITSFASNEDFDASKIYDKLDLKIYHNRGVILNYRGTVHEGKSHIEPITGVWHTNSTLQSSALWSAVDANYFHPFNQTNLEFTLTFEIPGSTNIYSQKIDTKEFKKYPQPVNRGYRDNAR